jgi:hypothetical protein
MRWLRRRDTKRRLTGISVSLTGATLNWQAEKSERRRARESCIIWRITGHSTMSVMSSLSRQLSSLLRICALI